MGNIKNDPQWIIYAKIGELIKTARILCDAEEVTNDGICLLRDKIKEFDEAAEAERKDIKERQDKLDAEIAEDRASTKDENQTNGKV